MNRTSAHLRAVAIGLALALVSSPISAGDFWPLHHEKKSCFDKSCDTTRVVIPSRQVEVVNERPQVIVRDSPSREIVTRTLRHQTLAAPLAIGTIYMPMALPTVGAFPMFGVPQPAVRETVETVPNHLESLHRAEVAQFQANLHAEKARAELNVTLAAQQRVAARLGAGPVAPESGKCESSVEKKLAELTSQMKEMNDRVTSIERLLLIHDNIIRDKVLTGPGAKPVEKVAEPPIVTPTKPGLPMIPPLP